MIEILSQLWRHITPQRRLQFGLLLGLTLICSVAEVVSLGAVLPFIGILTQPERVFASPLLANIVDAFGIQSSEELILPLAVGFGVAALVAGSLRLVLLWVSVRLANSTGADLSIEIYRRTLYQSYSIHIARNSSEVISGITQKVSTATGMLVSLVTVFTSSALFASIIVALLAVDPLVTLVAVMGFGLAYGLIAWTTRLRLLRNSLYISESQTQVLKALQEGLGAIRDILLDGTQEVYCNAYTKSILKLQRAAGENNFINQAPRYAIEALGMVLIVVFVLSLSHRDEGVAAAFPLLAALALGAQRLLPLMQQLYGNWSVIMGGRAALVEVLALLDQPLPAHLGLSESLTFGREIRFDNVSFRYESHAPWVLENINLAISKGARVGIIGSTGCGKSTLLDILMGLLQPTNGNIMVDQQVLGLVNARSWQSLVAHVPQSIFLADASIAENIAFGVPRDEIVFDRVRKAAQQAKIAEFIENSPAGYSAIVGERGVRLSGGQRQRIGIARALYRQAEVLIFDEATSALDGETELGVMQAIEGLSQELTLFIVAHRLTTLESCELIIKLEQGRVVRVGTYAQIADVSFGR